MCQGHFYRDHAFSKNLASFWLMRVRGLITGHTRLDNCKHLST